MAEAAEGIAADIVRRALESGKASRNEAIDSANDLLQRLNAAERELTLVLRSVSQEADTLRGQLERVRLLSGATVAQALELPSAEARTSLPVEAETPVEADALSGPSTQTGAVAAPVEQGAPVDDALEPDAPGVTEIAALSGPDEAEAQAAEDAEAHAAEDAEAHAAEDAGHHVSPAVASAPLPVSSEVGADSSTLDESARARVSRKTDRELADLYQVSTERAAGEDDDEHQVYWGALVRAIVREAVSRPGFGRADSEYQPGGFKERRRQAKRLKALSDAREQALEAWGADSSNPSGS